MKTYRKISIVCLWLLLVLGLFLGTQGAVKADQSDEDKVAHQIGNYQKALEKRVFRQMKSGKSQTLRKFYRAYRAHKYQKAFEIIKPFAERGLTYAQVYLGVMYNNGQGVAKDHTEAAKWYRKAAMLRWPIAQKLLGTMYAIGHGVPQDYKEAAKWFRKVAGQGDPGAQLLLGKMYAKGKGVPQDYVQAHKWFNISASRSHGKEHEEAVRNRNIIKKKMTPTQVAEALKLASKWKPNYWKELSQQN